jgi:hypothetical protein
MVSNRVSALYGNNVSISEIIISIIEQRSWSSSVSIVSDYGLDDQAIEDRSPAEAKGFFL